MTLPSDRPEAPAPTPSPSGAKAEASRSAGAEAASQPPRRDVRELLQGGREVRLVHDGIEYRLRVTRQGRLILTK